jgi:hypothetical protein
LVWGAVGVVLGLLANAVVLPPVLFPPSRLGPGQDYVEERVIPVVVVGAASAVLSLVLLATGVHACFRGGSRSLGVGLLIGVSAGMICVGVACYVFLTAAT